MASVAPRSPPEFLASHKDKDKDEANSVVGDAHSGISTIVEPADDRHIGIDEPGDEEVDIAEGGKPDPFEVRMGPNDADNPKSWSKTYRWYVTALSALLLLNAYVSKPPRPTQFRRLTDRFPERSPHLRLRESCLCFKSSSDLARR